MAPKWERYGDAIGVTIEFRDEITEASRNNHVQKMAKKVKHKRARELWSRFKLQMKNITQQGNGHSILEDLMPVQTKRS